MIFVFIYILPRTECEYSTSIFVIKSNFSNLLKSLASEFLSRSENCRIESYRGLSCLQFERLFRQIGQLELEIYSKTSEQLWKLKKDFEHWYLENASVKKCLSVTFVFSGPKYMKNGVVARPGTWKNREMTRNFFVDREFF